MIVSLCCKKGLKIVSSESGEHYICEQCNKPAEAHCSLILDPKEFDYADVF